MLRKLRAHLTYANVVAVALAAALVPALTAANSSGAHSPSGRLSRSKHHKKHHKKTGFSESVEFEGSGSYSLHYVVPEPGFGAYTLDSSGTIAWDTLYKPLKVFKVMPPTTPGKFPPSAFQDDLLPKPSTNWTAMVTDSEGGGPPCNANGTQTQNPPGQMWVASKHGSLTFTTEATNNGWNTSPGDNCGAGGYGAWVYDGGGAGYAPDALFPSVTFSVPFKELQQNRKITMNVKSPGKNNPGAPCGGGHAEGASSCSASQDWSGTITIRRKGAIGKF